MSAPAAAAQHEQGRESANVPPWKTVPAPKGTLRCTNTSQKLESAIFNAVSLGQWEVARAHFVALGASGGDGDRGDPTSRENARELLKLLIMESSNYWSGSVAVPTPHHLSWLALQTYYSLYTSPEEQLPDYVEKLIEFRLLLCSVLSDSSPSAISVSSALCRYHTTHVLAIPGAASDPASPFQSSILAFLHNVLVSKPATGHALIQSLMAPDSPAYLVNNEALQILYVEAIYESLEAVLQLKLPEAMETDSDSQYESDHTWTTANRGRQSVTRECQRLTTLVYDLLSLMDPRPEMTRVSIDKLFVYLLEFSHQLGPDKPVRFDPSGIYSCLVGRSSLYLLKRLHEAEEFLRLREANRCGGSEENIGGWSLRLLRETGSSRDWRGLFYHAYHDHKHLLECVLDIGLQLIRVGRIQEVSQLLSKPEFSPLRPLLLLLGWDVYVAEGSGKALTEALWPSPVSLSQPLLYEGCCRLAFQVELVQWCLEKARPHLLSSVSTSPAPLPHSSHPHSYRAGDMFKGLESHSVLYILHHYTPLAALDPLEVVEILKHRPRVPSLSIPITPPPQFSRGPTPHRSTKESEASSPLHTLQRQLSEGTKMRPEQERDIAIFRSFRVLKLVLDALWAAVQIESGVCPVCPGEESKEDVREEEEGELHLDAATDQKAQREAKTRSSAARKLDFSRDDNTAEGGEQPSEGRAEQDDPSTRTSNLYNQTYQKLVLDRFQEARGYVSQLYPLNYRLEVLENIFSLLFLTSEDILPLQQQEEDGRVTSTATVSSCNFGSSAVGGSEHQPLSLQSDNEYSTLLSSMALIRSRHGFLIDEKVAGDLLNVLQDSMFEMRAARFVLTQPATSETAPTLWPDDIRSSVTSASALQRGAKLEQYINEARWRLQLVSSKHGIVSGRERRDNSESSVVDYSSSGDAGTEVSESDTELEEKNEREGGKRKRSRAKISTDSHDPNPTIVHPPPEVEVTPLISPNRPPPTVMSRSTYSDKVSPSFVPQSTGESRFPSTSSPRLGSPRLGNHSNFRQGSPRVFDKRATGPAPCGGSPRPISASSRGSSDAPPLLCEVDSGDCADVEEKSPQRRKRKKRLLSRSVQAAKKRRRRVSERADIVGSPSHGSVVSLMLASPSSLLRLCLRHSNYSRAYEVLKMFAMEGQFGEALVRFSEKYESVSRELAEKSRSSSPKHSPSLTPQDSSRTHTRSSSSSSSALQHNTHLHVAIANASSGSSVLENLHHLLAPTSLHRVLLGGDEHLEEAAQDETTIQILMEHAASLVMLDVLCSTQVDGQVVKKIIEEASSRCQPVLESLPVKPHARSRRLSSGKKASSIHNLNLPGPFSLLLLLTELSGYFTTPSLRLLHPPPPPPPPPYHSPHTLLTSFTHQLTTSSITNYKTLQDSYHNARDRLSKLLQPDTPVEGDIITALTRSDPPLDEPQRSLSHTLAQRNILNTLFEELVHVLAGGRRTPALPGSPRQRGLMRQTSSVAIEPDTPSLGVGGVNTNFVLQFSRYLSQLMDLLLKCLSPNPTALSEVSLLLSILQESPSRLLGRLVFEVGVAPQRLEVLMASFHHIHMMEVLVQCCCPRLPAHSPFVGPPRAAPPPPEGVLALNEGDGEEDTSITDLCIFSERLLTKLISLLKEHTTPATTQEGFVSTEDLLAVYNSPQMKKLIATTTNLASVDLRTLTTTAKRISFYSNVVNFLYAHCVMLCVVGAHGETAGVLKPSQVSLGELQRSPVLQAGVFSRLGYRIGQLGLISCHDLHYSILRRGLSSSHVGRDTQLHCRLAPIKPDPWAQFSAATSDPRLLYVVHPGPASSPLPVPLHPDDVVSLLKTAERRYLSQRIRIDVAAKEVTVPVRLFSHRDDFGRPLWNDKYGGNSTLHYMPDYSLLGYLQSHIAREQGELLQPLVVACEAAMTRKSPLPVKILVRRESREFGYHFPATASPEGPSSRGVDGSGSASTSGLFSPLSSPKVLRKRLSHLRDSQTDVRESAELRLPQPAKGYTFTPEILTFVTHQNPLLAALIHLLCPPPPSPPSLSLTSSSPPPRKMSKMTGSEEEGTAGIGATGGDSASEGEREEERSRKSTMFGLRGRAKMQLTRRMSYDNLTPLPPSVSSWHRDLNDILIQFVTLEPMQRFLQARLSGFNGVLPWELPEMMTMSSGGKRGMSSSGSSALPEPRDPLRCLALLPSRGSRLGDACSYTLHRLLETGRVQDAVFFLASEPVACNRRHLYLLCDLAVSSAFVQSYSETLSLGHSGETGHDPISTSLTTVTSPLSLLSQLSDAEMASRLVLSSLHNWPVETCRNLLSFCFHHLPPSSLLLCTVKLKLERVQIYACVMNTCKSLLFTRAGREKEKERGSWSRWTHLASDTEKKPQYVLDVLLAQKAFSLARRWAHAHSLPQTITQQVEVDYLSALLEGNSPDPMSARRVLDSLEEDRLRLYVCESVLEQRVQEVVRGPLSHVETIIFILHYVLSELDGSLGEAKRVKYINWLLGAKALLRLPKAERSEYRSLIGHAALLVEQLLINKKVELAAVVARELRRDRNIGVLSIPEMPRKREHVSPALSREECGDPFTPLFVFYAGKTLEFPEPVITSSIAHTHSMSTTAQSTRPTSPGYTISLPPTLPLSPAHTEPPSRMSFTQRRKRASQPPTSPTPSYHTDSAHSYEPPPVPPLKGKWEPNAKATHCQVCRDVYFGMFNRRHHCRRCGRVVCARCSPFLSRVEGYGERLQRVCKDCHSFEQSVNVPEDATDSSDYLAQVYPALSPSPLQRWKLIPDDTAYNNNIRSEFYYEESPSSTLCLSLVDLVPSRRLVAGYLLDCCHSVSLHLVPDTLGRVNREVDHYFVIRLIQNLLWSAKLRFEEAADSTGVEMCDTYLSRVDLLRQLVSSRSHIIPSIQELARPELARRVRDRLVQRDQFVLAMEVSTKCQLDTSPVWSAWGMACLRCGDLAKARDRFKHRFQMSSQRGSGVASGRRSSVVGVANIQLLERILDQLEQNPLCITNRNTQPVDVWSSVLVNISSLKEKYSDDCDLDRHRFEECLHYLQSYGNHSMTVAFFARHNCWTNACKYILDEKCTVEVFVEQLWVPALKAGVIDQVQDILKALDHSLGQWEPYLTGVCQFFSQRSLYHVLYQTQLYMRDFIRAGMTCIKFFIGFSGRGTTIRDLFSRLHYLSTAQRHFQSALDAKQRVRERPAGGRGRGYLRSSEEYPVLGTSTKNMSIPDLRSHISTIALQIKVTEFMYRCAEVSDTLRSPLTTSGEGAGANNTGGRGRKPPQPITLFSSGHTRAEVAVQLILKSQDVLEGFALAQEIVTAYKLPPSNILCEASQDLAAAQRYGDIRVLLDCLSKSPFASDTHNDEILMAAIKVMASQTKETKQVEKFVQLLRDERSKIKALVQCGKLKNAYLIAIKSGHVQEVRNISQIAEKAGQFAVKNICEKWLLANAGPRR